MSKNINLYWSICGGDTEDDYTDALYLLTEEPDNLYDHLVKNIDKEDVNTSNYTLCPAVINETKKIYIVRSPIDYTISWTGDSLTTNEYGQSFFDKMVYVRSINSGYITLGFPRIVVYADSEVYLKQYPAFLNESDFSRKTRMVPGGFDISSWFRPLDPTFQILEKNTTIEIKKGDPLYYIIVDTDEEVTFKKFMMTADLRSMMGKCTKLKALITNRKLKTLYSMFTRSNLNKIILNNIKSQLV